MTMLTAVALALAVTLWPIGRPPATGRRGGLPATTSRGSAASALRPPPDPRATSWRESCTRVLVWPAGRRRGAGGASPDQVADALVLMALALRAGLGLMEVLDQVQRCSDGRARRQLAMVVAAVRWGRPASEAWRFAGPAWRDAALALQVAERTGAPPADLLEQAAARLREAQERDGERRAARAGVLLVLPLGLGFLPAFACTAVIPVVVALADGVLHG